MSCKREQKIADDKNGHGSSDAALLMSSSQTASFYRVMFFTQDGDQKMFIPATSVGDSARGKDSVDKLLNAVNPLLCYTGIIKVRVM